MKTKKGISSRCDWWKSLALGGTLLAARLAAGETNGPWDTLSDTWVATDGLGRSLPTSVECGPPRPEKFVGIFYFLWLEGKIPVYDLTKILAANPNHPAYGPKSAFHFWGEPLFGYYRSDDEAIIRKHAQMLSDAGVDVLIFDVTNGLIYEQNYLAVCRVLEAMRREGLCTPQIAFFANSGHERVVNELNQKFYSKNLYTNLWFRWRGKPLLLTPSEGLNAAATNFFTLRRSWAWSDPKGWFGNGRDKWPWLDNTPQNYGWHTSPRQPEEISVAVAGHPISNVGRSYFNGQEPPPGQARPAIGLHFGEQWARALQVDPQFVFVTGWNEWVAQRFIKEAGKAPTEMCGKPLRPGDTYFVDTFSEEFSRDIEPMKGGHGDDYYYQLVNYIRRYKGVHTLPAVSSEPIQVDGHFDDWKDVTPEFRDSIGDPMHRDHPGWEGQPRFVNQTGRNDIVAAKVSADADKIYFYVRTREPLTACTDSNWMLLFIDADHNPKTGWLGYDFVVNRSGVGTHQTTIERNVGGKYQWDQPTPIEYRAVGNELELAVARETFEMKDDDFTLDFKWADNIQQTGDGSDFTLNGDAAPNDRFNYRATHTASKQIKLADKKQKP